MLTSGAALSGKAFRHTSIASLFSYVQYCLPFWANRNKFWQDPGFVLVLDDPYHRVDFSEPHF